MRRLAVLIASAAAAARRGRPGGRRGPHRRRVQAGRLPLGRRAAAGGLQGALGPMQIAAARAEDRGLGGKMLQFTGGFKTVTNYASDKNCDAVLAGGAEQGRRGAGARPSPTGSRRRTARARRSTSSRTAPAGSCCATRWRSRRPDRGLADRWPSRTRSRSARRTAGSTTIAQACSRTGCLPGARPRRRPGKAMLAKSRAPCPTRRAQGGTDWTVIGAAKDELVTPESALAHGRGAQDDLPRTPSSRTRRCCRRHLRRSATRRSPTSTAGTDVIEWRKAPHVAERVGPEPGLRRRRQPSARRPTRAQGCTGSNDATGGPVIVRFPGLWSWTGTADMSYIKSGILEAYADCFKKADGQGSSRPTATVRLNGLDITPATGEVVTIDPAKRRVVARTGCRCRSRRGASAGSRSRSCATRELDWYLPKEAGALRGRGPRRLQALRRRRSSPGCKLKGSLKLSLGQGSTNLEGTLALPGFFQGKVPAGGKPECGNGIDDDGDGTRPTPPTTTATRPPTTTRTRPTTRASRSR